MGKLRTVNGNFYQDNYMTFDECYDLIVELSQSQGFYGRLLRAINELEPDDAKILQDEWEGKRFTNHIDFILYLEGGE